MGFLDALLGRTKPAAANLERLFGLPGAAVTLEAAEGLVSTLEAAVCFKPAVGQAFAATEDELRSLLDLGTTPGGGPAGGPAARLTEQTDTFGYRWVVVTGGELDELVTRVHFVNSTLDEHGYSPQLLCSVFSFRTGNSGPGAPPPPSASVESADKQGGPRTYFVYLFKRGTFYPFVPTGPEQRDNEAELRLRSVIGGDLAIEADLDRWFPLWDLPIH